MTLLLILFLITLLLFALFLGGGLVAQGYLYQQPAERLPMRALAGALLVGAFITIWVSIDRAAPRKYDTFFEFAPYQRKDFSEFEAVRWISSDGTKLKVDPSGNPVEVMVKFKRGTGTKSDTFVEEGTDLPFQLNSSGKSGDSYMTAAMRIKPTPDAEPVRFNARLKGGAVKTYYPGAEGRRFTEENGSRYIQADELGVLYVPSTTTVVLALFLNFVHFLIWFVAFWAILQFTRGHAFMLAVAFGLVTMLLLLPLLFKIHREPKPAEIPKTAWIQQSEDREPRTGERNPAGPASPV